MSNRKRKGAREVEVESEWDVEQYRHPWDSAEQWEVRRSFMLAHKQSMPEERLVCLAQVFANMEFLQCSYPVDVMEEVRELSVGINEEYREKKKNKNLIAFVKQSEDDAKGSNIYKTSKPTSSAPSRPVPEAKRTRWEETEKSTSHSNRPSASSFFGPNTGAPTSEPHQNISNKYHVQSYYTSTYRSANRNMADATSGSVHGPGEVPNSRPYNVDTHSYGTVQVEAAQQSGNHSNNADNCPNYLSGRTTNTFQGVSSNWME